MSIASWLRKLSERAFLRFFTLLVAEADTEVELSLSQNRQALIERAKELEAKNSPEFNDLAAELRTAAANLAHDPARGANAVVAALESGHPALAAPSSNPPALSAPKKRRGRPPKPTSDASSTTEPSSE